MAYSIHSFGGSDQNMQSLTIRLTGIDRPALVVGGSRHAEQVIEHLMRAGMPVRWCCTELSPARAQWARRRSITRYPRFFTEDDVASAQMVIAAADDATLNETAGRAARQAGVLFRNALTGHGDFELCAETDRPARREDPWQHAQVCLVGAGPGDPGLLTLDAERALASADIVLYDRLVAPAILAMAPPGAERRFVGKRRDHHHMRQPALNALMIEQALEGRRVVRLKGGDPFVFGRGAEELIDLTAAGIATRVIPGITAGSACATYADIPLTHRGVAASCQFLTAHGRDGELEHDWTSLVRGGHTLVVYMGVMALNNLCPALTRHGMRTDTPAALIERGTTPEQRVLTGTVSTLPAIAARHTVTSPAVLIVGDVVRLRDTLQAHRADQAGGTARPGVAGRVYGF